MTKNLAIKLLKAVACCSTAELTCEECPLYDEHDGCRPWTTEEVTDAVRFLNKEADNG